MKKILFTHDTGVTVVSVNGGDNNTKRFHKDAMVTIKGNVIDVIENGEVLERLIMEDTIITYRASHLN